MNKDIRRRYVGSCYVLDTENKKPQFDISSIILRLILFDTFILQSNNLDEFVILVENFGYGGVKEILSSGALRIHSEAHAVGQTGQTGLGFRGKKKDGTPKDLLPLNSFSFDIIMHADSKKIMHRNMQKIHNIGNIHHKEAIKLKKLIANNLVNYPKESTSYILNQMINDFKNNTPNIKKAIISSVKILEQTLAQRLRDEGSEVVTNCHQLKMKAPDGKMRKTDCANTEGLFRIIQSVPSPKAEPFKRWLAKVGYERVQEIENPELAQERMKSLYEQKGYPKNWIDKRLRGMAIRQNLTDEWKERGIKEQKDYAILTAEISRATFGMTPGEYKKHKNIPAKSKANLRDNMTDLELIFTTLGEKVTTEISR